MKSLSEARNSLMVELRGAGFEVSKDAMDPLRRIDFEKLVNVFDHEEFFLEETFKRTLLTIRAARVSTSTDEGMITADDVETALIMLGTAIPRQSEQTLSKSTKNAIKDSCGFCKSQRR